MTLTLRQRFSLTLVPLVALVTVLGIAGVFLVQRLSNSVRDILRENYDSVVAMQDLKESLERIDSSFQFMLVARGIKDQKERESLEQKAREQFKLNWRILRRCST